MQRWYNAGVAVGQFEMTARPIYEGIQEKLSQAYAFGDKGENQVFG